MPRRIGFVRRRLERNAGWRWLHISHFGHVAVTGNNTRLFTIVVSNGLTLDAARPLDKRVNYPGTTEARRNRGVLQFWLLHHYLLRGQEGLPAVVLKSEHRRHASFQKRFLAGCLHL
jgi:hypothetical protein